MKKFLLISLSLVCVISIVGCTKKDALRFKEEYERLNGEKSASGQVIREVEIDKNNPFIYADASDIVSRINNNETFIVYFGFASCPWCRSIIENLVKAAKDTNTKTIYYVDVLNIRDVLKVDDNGNVYTDSKGDTHYIELLSMIGDVLEDYTLTYKGNEIKTGKKRIYAPNIVAIKEGEAIAMTTGVSDKQKDAYMLLTDEVKTESYNKIKELLEEVNGVCIKGTC